MVEERGVWSGEGLIIYWGVIFLQINVRPKQERKTKRDIHFATRGKIVAKLFFEDHRSQRIFNEEYLRE